MSTSMSTLALLQVFIAPALLLYALYCLKKRTSRLPLPPGPPGHPLIGNAINRPRSFEWISYHNWSKDLGTDVLYLNVMGQSVIVLGSFDAASDLLDKRSLNYSSRPQATSIELIGGTYHLAMKEYGETWRLHRRLAHSFFSAPGSSDNYTSQVVHAAHNMMGRILAGSKDIRTEIRYMTGDAILSTCYGLDVTTPEAGHYLKMVHDGTEAFVDALRPGRFLVDLFPWMKHIPEWIPGAGFQKILEENRRTIKDMITLPFAASTKNMDKPGFPPCFVSAMSRAWKVGQQDGDNIRNETVRDIAGSMYIAGSDTTMTALTTCVLGLLGRPDVMRRAHLELDSVLELDRLPELEDEVSLPFITAIAKEALRWQTPLPLGVPHQNRSEDEYKGYRIPAGSVIMVNQWAMLHDERIYPDPFTFKPERFMEGDQLTKDTWDPEQVCWGFGRRICAGRYMAYASVWITIASLLYVFDVEKEVDEHGHAIEPNPTYISGMVCGPESFPCRIRPRSPGHAKLISDAIAIK